MRKIPQDPVMCLSFINTQLRDYYADFDKLCHDFEVNGEELEKKLLNIGYVYDKEQNRFR